MHLLAFYLKVVRDREYEKSHYMEDFGYTLHIYAYLCMQVQPPSSTTSILEALILTLSSALGKRKSEVWNAETADQEQALGILQCNEGGSFIARIIRHLKSNE